MKILGIDEAGKGPVIGPLVICGYLIDEHKTEELKKIGVKDSKLLSRKKREFLCEKVKKISLDYIVLKISPQDIDELRNRKNLNQIEIERIHQIINALNPDKAIIDSILANCSKFESLVKEGLKNNHELVCENYADKNYVEVGAASILAKVKRDREIGKLKKYGFHGTGYPSDQKTIQFLEQWLQDHKNFPPFVRKSWLTSKLIKERKEQKKWKDFI